MPDLLYVANVIGEELLPDPGDSDYETVDGHRYFYPPVQADEDEPVYVDYGDNETGLHVLVYAPDEDEADARIVRALGDMLTVDDLQLAAVQMPAGRLLHKCFDFAEMYESDGPLGHGWECGLCGRFLQAG